MHYWIDGHNLIGKMGDISLADEDDEAKLVQQLKRWANRDRRRQVTVFFDAGLPGGVERRWSGGRMTVIFASVGRTADALILARIRRIAPKTGDEYTVITSDQAIIKVVKQQSMRHMYAEFFAALMAQEDSPIIPPETDYPDISAEEVAEWLELFGPEPEYVPPPTPPKWHPDLAWPPEKIPPVDRQRMLRPRKIDRVRLTPAEVDAWFDLFAAAPTTSPSQDDKAPPPPSTTPPPPPKEPPLATRKRSTSKLSRDEVNAWMNIFRNEKKNEKK